jgi:hypothetical protein
MATRGDERAIYETINKAPRNVQPPNQIFLWKTVLVRTILKDLAALGENAYSALGENAYSTLI